MFNLFETFLFRFAFGAGDRIFSHILRVVREWRRAWLIRFLEDYLWSHLFMTLTRNVFIIVNLTSLMANHWLIRDADKYFGREERKSDEISVPGTLRCVIHTHLQSLPNPAWIMRKSIWAARNIDGAREDFASASTLDNFIIVYRSLGATLTHQSQSKLNADNFLDRWRIYFISCSDLITRSGLQSCTAKP